MSEQHNPSERKIDATLRLLSQAQPPADFRQRVQLRIDDERAAIESSFLEKARRYFFSQRIVFASAAAALGCCAIVIGSVQHSRQHILPATGVHIAAPGSGLGAASSTHIAPQPIPVPEQTHARSERKAAGGRATVSRDAHKPKGVAVPPSDPEKP